MLCLDTSIVIAALNSRRPDVRARLADHAEQQNAFTLSAIALHELQFGIAASARPDRNAAALAEFLRIGVAILDFDTEDAQEAGAIRAHLKRAGTPIGAFDMLIAAQARRREATLATLNGREFERVPGLRVADWSAASKA
ncbi:MAG: type II toxin-antitoxin system VapC family toxin [Alphaproteobacteria bacterium]|nr:type II toxin-antitoxin system VapC family toxin [Alphaproteobacteria bacterium]